MASDTHAQIHTCTHTHTLCCITNDATLIAVRVYLLLAVMDGPSLPGSQSEGDRKSVSSPVEMDTFHTSSSLYTKHVPKMLPLNTGNPFTLKISGSPLRSQLFLQLLQQSLY